MHKDVDLLRVKLFADGADLPSMIEIASNPYISGLTTNPTLMKKAGIVNYEAFARSVLAEISEKPISFEVFSDEPDEMIAQGLKIATWGNNVYVKVPITNTKGESTENVVQHLVNHGVKVNVTAIMTLHQIEKITKVLNPIIPSFISIFAGRIADTGVDPEPLIIDALEMLKGVDSGEVIWASPRELYNVFQADKIGCHVITATNDILAKLSLVGKDLTEYSLDTVKMFHEDAKSAGFDL